MSSKTAKILPLDISDYTGKKSSLLTEIDASNNNKLIKLRARLVPTKRAPNKHSLYLDISRNGKRERKYLKMYLDLKSNTKRIDRDTLKLALELRDKMELDIFQNEHDFEFKNHKIKANFVDYFKNLTDSKTSSVKPWKHTYNYLNKFTNGFVSFSQINEGFCEDFKEYLLKNVNPNSAHTYFARFKAALYRAVKDKIISENPAQYISVKKQDTEREFLTIDELKKIKNTPCMSEETKNAFLFTCFTGLRLSDVKNLKFSDLDNGYLNFRQIKTKGFERVKLSVNALEIIEKQKAGGNESEYVFNLITDSNTLRHISALAKDAGIKKHVTWHTGRHTFATLALTFDTDLYTVSKLLGHREIRTTQIYAKLIDKKKDEAIDKLPHI